MALKIKTHDGLSLHSLCVENKNPKAILLVVHGLNEHSGRYQHVFDYFKNDYQIYSYDHRGHGLSEGHKSHVDHFLDYVDDLKSVVKAIKKKHPHQKLIVLAHSMGGQITLNYVGRNQNHPVDLLITSSPNISAVVAFKSLTRAVGGFFAKKFPKHQLKRGGSLPYLTHDKDMLEAHKSDSLIQHQMSLSLGKEILENQDVIMELAHTIKIPTLMLHAGDDKICDPKGSELFYKDLASHDKALKIYPGMYHEILNEVDRAQVMQDIKDWLDERV